MGTNGYTYACELQHFGSEILENSRNVDCSLGADAHLVLGVVLQETLDTTTGELIGARLASVRIPFGPTWWVMVHRAAVLARDRPTNEASCRTGSDAMQQGAKKRVFAGKG